MATIMVIRTLTKATPTATARFEVTAAESAELTVDATAAELQGAAETVISGRHQDKPSMMTHIQLLRHLTKVWGMPMKKAAAAITAALDDGEHHILHL